MKYSFTFMRSRNDEGIIVQKLKYNVSRVNFKLLIGAYLHSYFRVLIVKSAPLERMQLWVCWFMPLKISCMSTCARVQIPLTPFLNFAPFLFSFFLNSILIKGIFYFKFFTCFDFSFLN